jgi:YcaO-like protein with predicted kinase domain
MPTDRHLDALAAVEDVPAFTEGTRRLVPPAETLRRAQPAMAAAGITRLARISGLDRIGIDVFTAIRPASRSLSVSQGKGVTAEAARASAVMEALELWHAEQHHITILNGTLAALAERFAIVDVRQLLRYEPDEPDRHRATRWAHAVDMLSGNPVLVPYETVHFDRRVPEDPADGVYCNGTNGLASGNSLTEAILHGLYEVIERDAVARSADRLDVDQPRLDLTSVRSAPARSLIDRFLAAGIELAVWDLSDVHQVPVYQALGVECTAPWYHPLPETWGFGAHSDPSIALTRALTEVAQVRSMIISGARDDLNRAMYASYFHPDVRAENAALLTPAGELVAFPPDPAVWPDATLSGELRRVLDRLRANGVREVAVVDLTHPDFAIPVVRVVVPGMWWTF